MSRKFVEEEGTEWIKKGIITSDQHHQILNLYSDKERTIGIIPLLGSVLIGLGILSFIAANWQEIPHIARLILILFFMIGFYFSGEYFLKKSQEKLGISMISLGLFSFGAGIILIAQMFQLQAYDVTSWIIWGVAAILLTFLYQSPYLYIISAVILSITQAYSIGEFNTFSYFTFLLVIIGLGFYLWTQKNRLISWIFSLAFVIQSIMMISVNDWSILWFFVPLFILYTVVDIVNHRNFYPFQVVALLTSYVFIIFLVITSNFYNSIYNTNEYLAGSLPFFITIVILFAISIYFKWKTKRLITTVDWILLPILLYLPYQVDYIYLIILFIYSLYLMWRGYAEEWRFKVDLGTFLFLVNTMIAYGKLTWGFMDRSLFFIVGGFILLGLGWFLNLQRNQFLQSDKEENGHD